MKKYLLFVLLFTAVNIKSAEIGINKKLTINDCFILAAKYNPDLKTSFSAMKRAEADLMASIGSYLPFINYNFTYNRQLSNIQPIVFEGRLIEAPNSYNMNAFAGITIFDGFNRENNYSRAYESKLASQYSVKGSEYSIKINIIRQFVEIIRNARIVAIRNENLELGRKDLERLTAQLEAGSIQKGQVYAQEADLGAREIELLDAQNNYLISKSNLLNIVGVNPNIEYDIDETSIPENVSSYDINNFKLLVGSFDEMLKTGFDSRPDLESAKHSLLASEHSIAIAKSTYYPSINANGGWQWGNTTFDNFNDRGFSFLGLNLRVPIFDQFQTNNQIENAHFNYISRQADLQRLEQTTALEIRNANLRLETAEKQMQVAEKALIASGLNYEIAEERFKVGSTGIFELFAANNQLVTSKINKINAITNYFLAQKELMFQLGQIDRVY